MLLYKEETELSLLQILALLKHIKTTTDLGLNLTRGVRRVLKECGLEKPSYEAFKCNPDWLKHTEERIWKLINHLEVLFEVGVLVFPLQQSHSTAASFKTDHQHLGLLYYILEEANLTAQEWLEPDATAHFTGVVALLHLTFHYADLHQLRSTMTTKKAKEQSNFLLGGYLSKGVVKLAGGSIRSGPLNLQESKEYKEVQRVVDKFRKSKRATGVASLRLYRTGMEALSMFRVQSHRNLAGDPK